MAAQQFKIVHSISALLFRINPGPGLILGLLAICVSVGHAGAAELTLQAGNLHNPYFSDRAPAMPAAAGSNYVLAPAPKTFFGIVGDVLPVPFTLVSAKAQKVAISIQLQAGGKDLPGFGSDAGGSLRLYRAMDVVVEGNSNASCSCPAGQLPQSGGARMACVAAAAANEKLTPKECPSAAERKKIAETLVRPAPFSVKDPLESVSGGKGSVEVLADRTELFVVDVPVNASLPKGNIQVRITATGAGNFSTTISVPMKILGVQLERFPTLDLSYWISEDPRDLVSRPAGTPLNGRWGGDWWGEQHWSNIKRAAEVQGRLAVTNTLVPLFVRNPLGVDSKPMIATRCITGGKDVPKDFAVSSGSVQLSPFNSQISGWQYDFDFRNFHRWIDAFKQAGFRQFEGAHLLANGGELPNSLECDLYTNSSDSEPYARGFRFMPRSGGSLESEAQKAIRTKIYVEKFLPVFLRQLHPEIKKAGIEQSYLQHIIDENASSDAAINAYAEGAAVVRANLPGIRTIDAINKFSALRYQALVDVPVIHLILIYNDQLERVGMRKEIGEAFSGRKYFYNTALRKGGPNRFVDTSPLDSRTYGWLALETGYNGFLYWASNNYRFPTARDLSTVARPSDWTPYLFSLGPLPNGSIAPGYGAGGNWVLYPTDSGLIDSLRARRLRDGYLDHWIYQQTWAKCQQASNSACRDKLLALRKRISADNLTIADFSRNPADYDEAREIMIQLLTQ